MMVDSSKAVKDFRKTGKIDEAEELCLQELEKNNDGQLKLQCSWVLYDKYVKGKEKIDPDFRFAEKKVDELSKNAENRSYYSYNKVKLLAAKLLSDSKLFDLALEKLNQLDKQDLNRDQFHAGNGKKYPSDIEKYYMQLTKALLGLERYPECLAACDEALSANFEFTNKDRTYIERRKACCLPPSEGLKLCEEILQKDHSWFLYKTAGEICEKIPDVKKAREYYCHSILSDIRDFDKKVNIFETLSDLEEDKEVRALLIKIAIEIRNRNDWAIKKSFEEKAEELGISTEKKYSFQELRSELMDYAVRMVYGEDRLTGRIKTILPNNKVGFISSEFKDYFFSVRDFYSPRKCLREGQPVTFYLERRLNKKKGLEEDNAVGILSDE